MRELRALGALQVSWGDFHCTIEPQAPLDIRDFAPRPTMPAPKVEEDDLGEGEDEAVRRARRSMEEARLQRERVEAELFEASEGVR